MKPTLIFILSLLILVACTKTEEPKNLLLPVPGKIIFGNDYVALPEPLSIEFSGNFPEEKKDLIKKELENTGIKLGENSENQISFILNDVEPNENYILNIASEGIRVEASSQAGVYHGLQSLKQLFALQMVDGQ
jgi:hexosaminidase